jgi:hypothetical protein
MKTSIIAKELARITSINYGVCKAEDVIKFAQNKNNPLHKCFEWDDKKASHEYRLWQARKLIVSVQFIPCADKPPVNVFVSLSPDRNKRDGGYRLMTDVLSNKEYRKILLNDAFREMQLFKDKYKLLTELESIFVAADKVMKKLHIKN